MSAPPIAYREPPEYRPGACNIGPAEIAARRRGGWAALAVAAILMAVLLVIGAPRWSRFLVAVPVGGAAIGFLQAQLRFCAGFAVRGVWNFGPLGSLEHVTDRRARLADLRKAVTMGLASALVGLAAGLAFFAALPA